MACDNVRTREGQRVLFYPVAQSCTMTQAEYEALTGVWIEVENVGQVPAQGMEVNYPTFNKVGNGLSEKTFGARTAASGSLMYATSPNAFGQQALRDLVKKNKYPLAIVFNDAPSGKTNTVLYNRAFFGYPAMDDAGLEDFEQETVAAELTDYQVRAKPVTAVALSNSSVPVISGTASVGETLTATAGAWLGSGPISATYQWQSEGVDIEGETGSTYVVGSGESGNDITVVVTATGNTGDQVSAVSTATTIS